MKIAATAPKKPEKTLCGRRQAPREPMERAPKRITPAATNDKNLPRWPSTAANTPPAPASPPRAWRPTSQILHAPPPPPPPLPLKTNSSHTPEMTESFCNRLVMTLGTFHNLMLQMSSLGLRFVKLFLHKTKGKVLPHNFQETRK